MNMRIVRISTVLAALAAPLLTTSVASAQWYDGPRFRGGVALEGGALAVPSVVTLGSIGVVGQLGVQINHNWGVYAIPNLDILFGELGGVGIGAGLLVDYTFNGLPISVGGGPEVGFFAAFGGTGCTTDANGTACTGVSDAGGAFYGARVHFAYYPVIVRTEGRPRRRALAIGFDLRLMDGAFGTASATANGGSASVSVNSFGLWPMLSVGYQAF